MLADVHKRRLWIVQHDFRLYPLESAALFVERRFFLDLQLFDKVHVFACTLCLEAKTHAVVHCFVFLVIGAIDEWGNAAPRMARKPQEHFICRHRHFADTPFDFLLNHII